MACTCEDGYVNIGEECIKTTVIADIECPENCNTIILENGNARCECVDSIDPVTEPVRSPVYFDNQEYFKDVSWTISYKVGEGWNSYFSFYPDYSISHNGFFQVGYNWGEDKETLWSHLLNNNSFNVFQGKYHPWTLEFPVSTGGGNKILNSLSMDIEAKRYLNGYDEVVYPNIGVTDMYIYNSKNNSGHLVLDSQKSLTDNRNYPKTVGDKQHILTVFDEGKQKTNYFFNRVLNERNGVPMFLRDENNIFKTINNNSVRFGGKRVVERMVGDNFIVHIENTQDSRFNIQVKSVVTDETITN